MLKCFFDIVSQSYSSTRLLIVRRSRSTLVGQENPLVAMEKKKRKKSKRKKWINISHIVVYFCFVFVFKKEVPSVNETFHYPIFRTTVKKYPSALSVKNVL